MGLQDRDYWREKSREAEHGQPRRQRSVLSGSRVSGMSAWRIAAIWVVIAVVLAAVLKAAGFYDLADRRAKPAHRPSPAAAPAPDTPKSTRSI